MYGHTSEKTWQYATDQVGRKLGKLAEFLIQNEALYQEFLDLWNYHGDDDEKVCNQLFGESDANKLNMVRDLKNAVEAAHKLYVDADWKSIRRMT